MKKIKIVLLSLLAITAFPVSAHNHTGANCPCFCSSVICEKSIPDYYLITDKALYNQLKGRIILTVQNNGEAFYVSTVEKKAFYLGDRARALKVFQNLGTGTFTKTLNRVPVGYFNLSGADADRDGLPDVFEVAINTDTHNFNTDGDRYSDKTEVDNGYNPKSFDTDQLRMDSTVKGRIFLQAEQNGEAWYMNPVDGRRYWLSTNNDAENLIKEFGLGISNYNFERLVK